MIVKMKRYERDCIDYCAKFKNWEVKCAAKDSWLNGFKKALEILNYTAVSDCHGVTLYHITPHDFLNEEVEVEFKDGEHQLNG